jgi:peptide/nickel transport system permease protein
MVKYVFIRLLTIIPVLFGVMVFTFVIFQFLPGDPAADMLGPLATPEKIAEVRAELGLDDPLWVQFGSFLTNAIRGDLGTSFRGQRPVLQEILSRFPETLKLTFFGMTVAVFGGVGAGVIATVSKNKWLERFMLVFTLGGLSIPSFWLAIISILIFSVGLNWFSATGGDGWKDLILPSFVIAAGPAAVLARTTRTSLLQVTRAEYVRTARAKGASERRVLLKHILSNAMIPIVTVIGLQTADLMTGAVFIESVFARSGVGRLAITAVFSRDYPMIRGIVIFGAFVYIFVNLFIDLLYGILDPRIRYE